MSIRPYKFILAAALASIFCTLGLLGRSSAAEPPFFIYKFQTLESAQYACPSISKASFEQEMNAKQSEIPLIEAMAPQFKDFLQAHPEILSLYPTKTPVLSFQTGCDWRGYAAQVRITPGHNAELDAPQIEYVFHVPDQAHFELERNALFHEMGHFVMDSLIAQGLVPRLSEDEAFADFFAYSITGDPNMGKFLDPQTKQPRILRVMKSTLKTGPIYANQVWNFNYVDSYEAGARFRDALIVISEKYGFEEAFGALKAVIKRQIEIGGPVTAHDDRKKVSRYAEQACREVMAKYFPSTRL